MKKLLISVFLFVSFLTFLSAQEVVVTSALDSSRIYIGDQINYHVTVDQPSGLKLKLPFLQDTLCNNIEILSGPVIDSGAIKDGRIKITEKYLVTSFDSGSYNVPPAFAEIKDDNGLKRFYSGYNRLRVMRVNIAPADTAAKIYDIVKPFKAPVTAGEILPWILLVLIAGAVSWLAVRYLKKFAKLHKSPEIESIPDPAHIIAFRELEKLREEQYWQKGEIKKYYTILTEILRQYLVNRFRVFSFEMTTSETLEELVKNGFRKEGPYNLLKAVLTGADLVKFAKHKPGAVENETYFRQSWDFVDATREKLVVTAEDDLNNKTVEASL